jgi:hypothetical protein
MNLNLNKKKDRSNGSEFGSKWGSIDWILIWVIKWSIKWFWNPVKMQINQMIFNLNQIDGISIEVWIRAKRRMDQLNLNLDQKWWIKNDGSKMMDQINLNLNSGKKEDRSNGTGFEGKGGSIKYFWIWIKK